MTNDREPKITEAALPVGAQNNVGCLILLSVIIYIALVVIFYLDTRDIRLIYLFSAIGIFLAYFYGRTYIMDLLDPKMEIVVGRVTWKREYLATSYGRNGEERVWHYWVYLGSVKVDVSESKYKVIDEGDLLKVERAKRSKMLINVKLLEKGNNANP